MQPADLFLVVATGLAWSTLIPQIRRLWKTLDTSGVSITWPMIGFVSNAAWTAYLVSQSLWPAAISTVGMLVFYVVVIRALGTAGAPLRRPAVRGLIWLTALIAIRAAFGWTALGLTLGWSYAAQMTPAIFSTYRSRDPSGVSVGSWVMITVESLLWGGYGWIQSDLPIMVYAVTGTVSGILILARVGSSQRSTAVGAGTIPPPMASTDERL